MKGSLLGASREGSSRIKREKQSTWEEKLPGHCHKNVTIGLLQLYHTELI